MFPALSNPYVRIVEWVTLEGAVNLAPAQSSYFTEHHLSVDSSYSYHYAVWQTSSGSYESAIYRVQINGTDWDVVSLSNVDGNGNALYGFFDCIHINGDMFIAGRINGHSGGSIIKIDTLYFTQSELQVLYDNEIFYIDCVVSGYIYLTATGNRLRRVRIDSFQDGIDVYTVDLPTNINTGYATHSDNQIMYYFHDSTGISRGMYGAMWVDTMTGHSTQIKSAYAEHHKINNGGSYDGNLIFMMKRKYYDISKIVRYNFTSTSKSELNVYNVTQDASWTHRASLGARVIYTTSRPSKTILFDAQSCSIISTSNTQHWILFGYRGYFYGWYDGLFMRTSTSQISINTLPSGAISDSGCVGYFGKYIIFLNSRNGLLHRLDVEAYSPSTITTLDYGTENYTFFMRWQTESSVQSDGRQRYQLDGFLWLVKQTGSTSYTIACVDIMNFEFNSDTTYHVTTSQHVSELSELLVVGEHGFWFRSNTKLIYLAITSQ